MMFKKSRVLTIQCFTSFSSHSTFLAVIKMDTGAAELDIGNPTGVRHVSAFQDLESCHKNKSNICTLHCVFTLASP